MIFAFVVMIAGGVREEIQRGFVLRRFEQYLGGGAVGLAIFSALFGLGHLEQGYDVAISTGVLGAFWGAIYLGAPLDPRTDDRPCRVQPGAGREVPDAWIGAWCRAGGLALGSPPSDNTGTP